MAQAEAAHPADRDIDVRLRIDPHQGRLHHLTGTQPQAGGALLRQDPHDVAFGNNPRRGVCLRRLDEQGADPSPPKLGDHLGQRRLRGDPRQRRGHHLAHAMAIGIRVQAFQTVPLHLSASC